MAILLKADAKTNVQVEKPILTIEFLFHFLLNCSQSSAANKPKHIKNQSLISIDDWAFHLENHLHKVS